MKQAGPISHFGRSLLHAYGQIFFTLSPGPALLVLLVTFLHWELGLAGLLAVLLTNGMARFLGIAKSFTEEGLPAMNSLLVAMSLAAHYEWSWVLVLIIALSSLFSLFLTLALMRWMGQMGLSVLSLPFLLVIWAILLATQQYEVLAYSERNIFLLNRLFEVGGTTLIAWSQWLEEIPLTDWIDSWLRSLAAILFQENRFAGILLTVAILWSSRISFLMALLGYGVGYAFYELVGADMDQLHYTYIGFNFILSAIALGGFFFIASRRTLLLVLATAPLIAIVLAASSGLFSIFSLPVYSLPFVAVVSIILYATGGSVELGKLPRPSLQTYSPERNLYAFDNYRKRFGRSVWYQLMLPFFGEWKVSQGFDGAYTHQGHWAQAWDFEIEDETGKTWQGEGLAVEDFYAYKLPVLAPGAGEVVDLLDGVPDNKPGEVNLSENWGNSLVLKHAEGLYSQLSHLLAGSFEVKKGDYVKRGQVLARLGNSGRSPKPHLHFQLQATPFIGSETISYPLAAYMSRPSEEGAFSLRLYDQPKEGELVSNIETSPLLRKAFHFVAGQKLRWETDSGRSGIWEIHLSSTNLYYLYCSEHGSRAWFYQDELFFYFTHFEGRFDCPLYLFYLTAYRVVLGYYENLIVEDFLPLYDLQRGSRRWLQDLLSSFWLYKKGSYRLHFAEREEGVLYLNTEIILRVLKKERSILETSWRISPSGFELEFTGTKSESAGIQKLIVHDEV